MTANAAPQRAGILGSLNEAGKPLRMMPSHPEGRRSWTVREWSKKRKGWIFITSTPDTIDALRPVQSLWLDMLILKLQTSAPEPGQPRVWMMLDELASLNALPQLHSALTKQRKSDNPIVLGFQGMSQLDAIYGKKAETILSQAYTNIVLRTREPRAAKHLSRTDRQSATRARSREQTVAPVRPQTRQLQHRASDGSGRHGVGNSGTRRPERVLRPAGQNRRRSGSIRNRNEDRRSGLIERIIPATQHRPLDPEPIRKPAVAGAQDPSVEVVAEGIPDED